MENRIRRERRILRVVETLLINVMMHEKRFAGFTDPDNERLLREALGALYQLKAELEVIERIEATSTTSFVARGRPTPGVAPHPGVTVNREAPGGQARAYSHPYPRQVGMRPNQRERALHVQCPPGDRW